MKKKLIGIKFFTNERLKINLIAMKLIVLLFLTPIVCMSAVGFSQNCKYTIDLKNVSAKKVLTEMENSCNVKFLYRNDQIDLEKQVSINVKDASMEAILGNLFPKNDITYKYFDNNLVVIATKTAQKVQIKGTVSSFKDNTPLPGVTVIEKGTTNGVFTDNNGNYTIETTTNAPVLIFSSIGYKTLEVPTNSMTIINVSLKEELTQLAEIVVVGYGSTKKKDLTGSISSIAMKDKESITT